VRELQQTRAREREREKERERKNDRERERERERGAWKRGTGKCNRRAEMALNGKKAPKLHLIKILIGMNESYLLGPSALTVRCCFVALAR
jgi:hypothetical protein